MDFSKIKKLKWLLLIIVVASFLRLYRLDQVPVSLFGDELDVGYHAYSILNTGKDYVGNPWPLHFQSLAEFRTPLYLYSAVPTVAIFGVSPLGVRLPAAFFGILSIIAFYYLTKQITKSEKIALISAAVLTFSPWHIQYSRAAFEVTQLLFFVLAGFYFFFYSLEKKENNKYLWLSTLSFGIAPWVYSTGKLFVPMIFTFLFFAYLKPLLKLDFKVKRNAILMILITAIPMVYAIVAGQSAQRFSYISVFTDPIIEPEIGFARDSDLIYLDNDDSLGAIQRRLFHNKYLFWGERISSNFLKTFSTDFLFIKGDINLRHSIEDVGQFYRADFLVLLLGIIFFFTKFKGTRIKLFFIAWFILGTIPSAITRDGGDHATRLILLLPPFVFLISYGIYYLSEKITKINLLNKSFLAIYLFAFALSFVFYQHNYWVHNPWYAERWWHSGYQEAIQSIKEIEDQYDTIVITNASEPPWIFFSAWYEYPPAKWQSEYPVETEKDMGIPFNKVTYIDKFHFGQVSKIGIYALGQYIDNKTLYMAAAREIGANLIQEPGRTPAGLNLVKAIAFPSGEPAFYLFEGAHDNIEKDPFAEVTE